MPGEPQEQPFTEGPVQGVMAVYHVDEVESYMVSCAEVPVATVKGASADSLLKGAARGAAANVGGRVVQERVIEYDGRWPGREFRITAPQLEVVARAFLVEQRLCHVTVGWPAQRSPIVDAYAFLDSFRLVFSDAGAGK